MKRNVPLLFLNVFVIATCGLIYELLAGTLASYVLGDSVTQFSVIIGLYLFAMGVGSWLSRFVENNLAERFIDIELAVAILGGVSAPLLFLTFANLSYFHLVLYGVVFGIGTLVGLEIPLLMRILKDELDFKKLVARVLALDYVGALAASLLFPIFLVPTLGLVRTSLVFGILNADSGSVGHLASFSIDKAREDSVPEDKRSVRDRAACDRRDKGRYAYGPCGRVAVPGDDNLREKLAVPEDCRDAWTDRFLAFSQRQSPVQFVRRIPVSRGPRTSGDAFL